MDHPAPVHDIPPATRLHKPLPRPDADLLTHEELERIVGGIGLPQTLQPPRD